MVADVPQSLFVVGGVVVCAGIVLFAVVGAVLVRIVRWMVRRSHPLSDYEVSTIRNSVQADNDRDPPPDSN